MFVEKLPRAKPESRFLKTIAKSKDEVGRLKTQSPKFRDSSDDDNAPKGGGGLSKR
jgi:hypothetical protein